MSPFSHIDVLRVVRQLAFRMSHLSRRPDIGRSAGNEWAALGTQSVADIPADFPIHCPT